MRPLLENQKWLIKQTIHSEDYLDRIAKYKLIDLPKAKGTHVHHIMPKCIERVDHPDNLVRLPVVEHAKLHGVLVSHFKAIGHKRLYYQMRAAHGGLTRSKGDVALPDEEYENAVKSMVGIKKSDETKGKMSKSATERYKDPEAKAKLSEQWKDPEIRDKRLTSMAALNSNKEHNDTMIRKVDKCPIKKARHSASAKAAGDRPWKSGRMKAELRLMEPYFRLHKIYDVWLTCDFKLYTDDLMDFKQKCSLGRNSRTIRKYFEKHGDPRQDSEWVQFMNDNKRVI